MMKSVVVLLGLCILPTLTHAEVTATIIEQKTKYGEISYPQISGLADKALEQTINNGIKAKMQDFSCDFKGSAYRDPAIYHFNAKSTLRFIDAQHLSFTVAIDQGCGWAYPDEHMNGYNINLETNRPIPVEDFLVPDMRDKALTKFLITDHQFSSGCMSSETNLSEMSEFYSDDSIDIEWNYYPTPDSIVFFPELGHGDQPCFEEFPIPLAKVAPYLAENAKR